MSQEPIGTELDDFISELWEEARQQGPEAVRDVSFAETYARLARQLHEARVAKGLTQTELSRRSAVPQADISRIETGQNNPTLKTLVSLAAELDCELLLVATDELAKIQVGRGQARNGQVSSLTDVIDRFKAHNMLPAEFEVDGDETDEAG